MAFQPSTIERSPGAGPWPRREASRRKATPGREWLYGRQPVHEALRAGRRRAYRLLVPRDGGRAREVEPLEELARSRHAVVAPAERRDLDELLGRVNHQGVALEVSGYPYAPVEGLPADAARRGAPPLLMLLDHLEDPQNFGSLLRTADAAGVDGVLIPADRAVGVTPAVVRASAGASEHMRVAVVVNLARAMQALQEQGFSLVGLDLAEASVPYTQADLGGALGLVIGGEGRGLGRLVRENCDRLIRIPMLGGVASLNASVAGAVALYEALRQREQLPSR